jgi:hypothetical protein
MGSKRVAATRARHAKKNRCGRAGETGAYCSIVDIVLSLRIARLLCGVQAVRCSRGLWAPALVAVWHEWGA